MALTLQAALAACTSGSARVTRSTSGVLRPGAPADVAVLSTDPFGVPAAALHATRVDLTVVCGRVVFERTDAGA
ncbi:amidohydrolase family protein [Arthrobacter agilis]|uniref:amidohydrolase family protein n=1 Tax=Arthrobacter agilis TaxID=37921 RepID=UPI0023655739|nr:amidohydrolase family protein [Arthrobacter agilis]WDF34110.1 amidohydrolase family protein [Arthrobacter agilis]